MAGLVLGVESVPDALAGGLLAGVNPVAGVYSAMFGMLGGALFTSTAFMAVQSTGAMSIIVADVDLASRAEPARALFTLSIVTGIVMIAAGVLKLGTVLRFVSNSVMTGFITAVGVNIVLGQLGDFTGYHAEGANRVTRAIDVLVHPGRFHLATLLVGVITVALIIALERTRLGSLGLVLAIIGGSMAAGVLAMLGQGVGVVRDVAQVPGSLPLPVLPDLQAIPSLIVPALSLAFVGLVQGAGVSAAFPDPTSGPTDASQDFVGQGAGNVVAGLFQGMPVGGSMSATSLVVSAGAKSRAAVLYASVVMAVVLVLFSSVVERVAMPALAALLIVIGVGTIKPAKVRSIARTGPVPLTTMVITFVLTLLIPLQYAVLVGAGLSVLLFVIRQSSRLVTRRIMFRADGRRVEVEPPTVLPPHDVVVIQPYGAIFFATASVLLDQMPTVGPESRGSVVILRIRGADDAGATLLDALTSYARSLSASGSKLMIVTDNQRVVEQIRATGAIAAIGPSNLRQGNAVVGEVLRDAHRDAREWVAAQSSQAGRPSPPVDEKDES